MSILGRFFEKRAHPSQADEWLIQALAGAMDTSTGVTVTPQTALQSSAVFACVRLLAETISSLPLPLYRRLDGDGKAKAIDHPLYSILHDLPNPEMTSMQLRETLITHQALWGNGFAEIEYNNAGQVRGLWPIPPWLMTIRRINRQLVYDVSMPVGPVARLPWGRVMHIPALGIDGVVGLSPITLARQAVGLALGTEEFGAKFFGNGARPGVVLEHPGQLSEDAQKRLRKSIEDRHQGLSNAHRMMLLEEGMQLKEVGIPPEDAQFLETRRFQTAEIARMFNVPPHMIGDLDRATFNNIEQLSLEFVIYSIRPWLVRWEQAILRDLLSEADRRELFAEHTVNGLLRGDIASRYNAYAIGRQWGWLSANDVRKLENMNPVAGGEDYLTPLNMVPAGSEPDPEAERALPISDLERRGLPTDIEARAQQTADDRLRIADSFQRVLLDVVERIIRRESNDVGRAVAKYLVRQNDPAAFLDWLSQFYEEHRQFWVRQLQPLLHTFADQVGLSVARELGEDPADNEAIADFIESYAEALAARQVGSSFGQIQALLESDDEADPAEEIDERLAAWEEDRPAQIARDESRQASNGFAKAFYVLAGISLLRWVSRGSDSCPYCRNLDGKVVGIEQFFVMKDLDFEPEGAERPLNSRTNIGHPPLHKGCDCQITAER